MSGCIGPSLPPGFAPREEEDDENETPPQMIGPLPPTTSTTSVDSPRTIIGPCMPPQSSVPSTTTPPESTTPSEDGAGRSYGPMLPPGLGVEPQSPDLVASPTHSESEESEEEEEDVIGPMPSAAGRSKVGVV